jgi:hypothetical protein
MSDIDVKSLSEDELVAGIRAAAADTNNLLAEAARRDIAVAVEWENRENEAKTAQYGQIKIKSMHKRMDKPLILRV